MEKWIRKGVIPAVAFIVLWVIFKPVFIVDGGIDLFRLWIVFGLPFGIARLCIWFLPRHTDIGSTVDILALNILLASVIGGFIAIYSIVVAILYLGSYPVIMIFSQFKEKTR